MEKRAVQLPFANIAFYRFQKIADPVQAQNFFRTQAVRFNLRGTVLVSHEGVNGSLAGELSEVRSFQDHLEVSSEWAGLEYKESYSAHIPFTRLAVKLKKEIIPIGDDSVEPEKWTAPPMPPETLKQWMDEKRDFTLLDTRNTYEIEYGTFEGAVDLKLRHFRNFREHLKSADLGENARAKPLVMFCTGGIRCEKASVVAHQEGYQEVYQLEGGILNYFEEMGGAHYDGRCFVFDERVALDPNLEPLNTCAI